MRPLLRSLWSAALLCCACATPPEAPRPPTERASPSPAVERVAPPAPAIVEAGPVVQTADAFTLPPRPRRSMRQEPPIRLTSADGKDLELRRVTAQSVLRGPIAFTELRLTFRNPEPRTIEGRFRITLPERASVSRLAMKVGGRWQEGEVVEQKRARRIYEDFLHQRVDPALLERGAGNSFAARVFPIRAGEDKELIVSYSQEIRRSDDALVPLSGLGEIDRLDVRVASAQGSPTAFRKTRVVPQDVLVGRADQRGAAARADSLFAARIVPQTSAAPQPLGPSLVLIDTSASRALDLDRQIDLAGALVARVAGTRGADTPVVVACFDQTIEVIHDGPAGELAPSALDRARRRRALGASDLRAALTWARPTAAERGLERLVLLSDGVITAGGEESRAVQAAGHLRDGGIVRIDAVAFGGIRDRETLGALVTAGLAQDGVVLDASKPRDEILRRLGQATTSGLEVAVAGARWFWPRRLDGVQPGDAVVIYAEAPGAEAPSIRVGAETFTPDYARVERPLIERAWAEAKIASLLDDERRWGRSETYRRSIVELSTRHRVLSPHTSLLVLETQGDYDRYGLDRDGLADILTVVGGRLKVEQRTAPTVPKRLARRAPPAAPFERRPTPPASDGARGDMWGDDITESSGDGGLGLRGIGEGGGGRGEGLGLGLGDVGTIGRGASAASASPATGTGQGFGSGSGRLGRSHRTRPPRVRMGKTQVSGRLPPEVIRRIVRQNFGRFRACYQDGLRRRPDLEGRVTVRFVIGRDGTVRNVSGSGGIGDDEVIQCVARAFWELSFPLPEGGIITVVYPLVFQPEGEALPPVPTLRDPSRERLAQRSSPTAPRPQTARGEPAVARPHRGRFESVMVMLKEGDEASALAEAQAWQSAAPGEVLALVALGEALEAADEPLWAARAYGSIVDLFPARADLRRFASARLERVAHPAALHLASDSYAEAARQRPDHPTSHRLLAYALLKEGRPEAAFDALEKGLSACVRRFAGAAPILQKDLGLVGAAWQRRAPEKAAQIAKRLSKRGARLATEPSLRFVLSWETDTNDVDLHVYDAEGGHAFYGAPALASGGQLSGDVTTGYGPEAFTIEGDARSTAYRLQAHYYARGPMGYGMGKVQIVGHDGRGGLTFDERPFVVMVDRGVVDLGEVGPSLLAKR